ncbi:MAG: tetratricopeptide repeat protein [Desulfobulbaceae bacterium]|nr:tetratricopeptide repeat protein [Desulfobulbaceae bacterium]
MGSQKESRKSKSGIPEKKPDKRIQTEAEPTFDDKARLGKTNVKQVLLALLIVVLFFSGLELILALSGVKSLLLTEDPSIRFATNLPLFVEQRQSDGTTILRTAKRKLGFFNYQEFPKIKGENTYRIFCVGGSTTFGRPFTDKASFSRWLQAFLTAADPARNWEVINAGGISYASYRVANLMRELAQYQPDLFIVYSGQNEFLEERSYRSLSDLPVWVINANALLSKTRTYSSMKRLFERLRSDSLLQARETFEVSGEVDDVLAHTIGPTSFKRNEDLRRRILEHYQRNLERMVEIAHDADAEVIFVKPAVNLKDMSPFKSAHKKGLSDGEITNWNSLYERAKKLHDAEKYTEALDYYQQALRIDDRYAELHFQMGRALFALGRYDESEKSFWRAVDEDIAPLRMLSTMPEILSTVAKQSDVPLVDFQSLLRAKSLQAYGYAVLGSEFFLDHVHTNKDGYRLLGQALFDQLGKQGVLASGSVLTAEKIAAVSEQVSSSFNVEDNRISFIHLGMVLDWAGKFEEARKILLKSLKLFGPQPEVFELLGKILSREGNAVEAMNYFHQALDAGYETAALYASLGNIYLEVKGDYAASLQAYQNSLRIKNDDPSVHVRLGYVYAYQGDFKSARSCYNEALRLQPDFFPAHVNLMALLYLEKRDEEALKKGYEILKDHPAEYKTHYMVGKIFLRQGNRGQAIQHFQAALRIEPQFKAAQDSLKEAQM